MKGGATTEFNDVLTAKVAVVTPGEASELARDHFGISAVATALTSERDQNFLLSVDSGEKYLLKITHPSEDRQITNFQTQALLHIAAVDPEYPTPRVQASIKGELEPVIQTADGTVRIARLLTFVEGVPLYQIEPTFALRRELGAWLARLGLALRDFTHPAAGHELLWDMKHSSRIRPLLAHIQNDERRTLAEYFLNHFEEHALPVLPQLRAQVIHNDFQPWNVLVDAANHDKLAGVIDFGDMVHAPLIDDLAVACAYHLTGAPEPLSYAAEIAAAYHEVLPLDSAEVDILYDLIAARLVITVAITGWRAMLHPENAPYILRNYTKAWDGLGRLATMERSQAQRVLRRACGMD